MSVLGNICLGLAFVVYLVTAGIAVRYRPGRGGDMGLEHFATITAVMIVLWLLLAGVLLASAARGAFVWLRCGRGAQYLLVVLAWAAMATVTWFSGALHYETSSQIPWAARLFIPWAVYVIPLVVLGFGGCALNPLIGSAMPTVVYRVPLAMLAGLSLLAGVGLVAQAIAIQQQRETAKVQRLVAQGNERDRTVLAEVEALDPMTDLPRLLNQTGQFETPAIRELALKKARSHPNFNEELARLLRGRWCGEALIFLEANEPPDAAALAEAVRDGFLSIATATRRRMNEEHYLYDDSFDADARRMLAVADKFRRFGVDYRPAIREFRAALEVPRQQKINPNCRRTIDQWLEKEIRNPKS